MKQRIQGIIIGFLVTALLFGSIMTVTGASVVWKKIEVGYDNYRIVIDGKEFKATDKDGVIEPFSYNGWIYAPFEKIANGLGKPVYWDGPAKTMYIGKMDGKLQYPTVRIEDAVNIGHGLGKSSIAEKTDNYDNTYATSFYMGGSTGGGTFETLLNMKYSRFKGTAYVARGTTSVNKWSFQIEADGKIIYSSPEITKISPPIKINVDITGCNDFKLITSSPLIRFGDCGFYQ